ncbi:MAG: hypothetical protein UZ14_CFX002000161 [Chloroflexi bacterium OLB14]|nr:MAG: hypothetical protein UZ14_CFX002000161 [Chloroflexi bacterium OLB14]
MNKINFQKVLGLVFLMFVMVACGNNQQANQINTESSNTQIVSGTDEVQVIISGGYELDPRDNGRPVILIASALGVPEEVFREAFSHVNPAGAGSSPSEEQAQANKAALMNVLAPYGVTNDYLDEVSNYYRYNRSAGETWPQILL